MNERGPHTDLSRRERQIMDAIYRRQRATVNDVLEDIPDPPSYSAVRAMIAKLEDKGHLRHRQDGPRYVYFPAHSREQARDTALRRVLRTFFDGSPTKAVAAVLDLSDEQLSNDDLEELQRLIDEAKARGR